MADPGYCTSADVKRALKGEGFSGALGAEPKIVEDAITGQNEWLRETTHRHWYESGSQEDIFTSAQTHDEDVLHIPASPHPGPSQQYRHSDIGTIRYPRPTQGRYTTVDLRRRDVQTISELLVLDATGEPTDWATEKTQGRGKDWYLQVDSSDGISTLYLDTASLPPRQNWDGAVIATYEWGIDGLSDTVRRAIALRAGAQLILDDDAQIGIPDNGQMVALESKAQRMRKDAKELLSIHMLETPIA